MDDFPTPPFPLATAMTRQSAGMRITPSSGAPPRSFCVSACRSSGVITSNESSTPVTPGTPASACSTCVSNESRSGQPAIVSTIVSATTPSCSSTIAHHVELRDRPPQLGVDHLLERLENLRRETAPSKARVPGGSRPQTAKPLPDGLAFHHRNLGRRRRPHDRDARTASRHVARAGGRCGCSRRSRSSAARSSARPCSRSAGATRRSRTPPRRAPSPTRRRATTSSPTRSPRRARRSRGSSGSPAQARASLQAAQASGATIAAQASAAQSQRNVRFGQARRRWRPPPGRSRAS